MYQARVEGGRFPECDCAQLENTMRCEGRRRVKRIIVGDVCSNRANMNTSKVGYGAARCNGARPRGVRWANGGLTRNSSARDKGISLVGYQQALLVPDSCLVVRAGASAHSSPRSPRRARPSKQRPACPTLVDPRWRRNSQIARRPTLPSSHLRSAPPPSFSERVLRTVLQPRHRIASCL